MATMSKAPSLFDFMELNEVEVKPKQSIVEVDKKKLKSILESMKRWINDGTLIKSDFYYNICFWRPYKIEKRYSDEYELRFATSSDSERMLTAYELNNDIKPLDFLNVGIASGAQRMLKLWIEDNPNGSTLDMLNHFRIFEYPHYYTRAKHINKETLEEVAQVLIDFAKLRESLTLTDTKFSFMREHKIRKLEDQSATIPRCFDGLCLEANIMKSLKEANNAGI
jgi:hypothetical protein